QAGTEYTTTDNYDPCMLFHCKTLLTFPFYQPGMMISLDPDVTQREPVELKLAVSIILPRARPPEHCWPQVPG
ncbi:MAG: hypothetical protein QF358_12295, partial [Arenicellales bacterium]|nr:hypothetical protein [Arenicellales bacterium]